MWFYYNTAEEFKLDDAEGYFGFVYLITHNPTGRKYIGKKFFTKAGTRQIKGKKKKIRKTSDWETYWGSNTELQAEVTKNGEEQYTREILHLCKSRSECSYWETFEILSVFVILTTLSAQLDIMGLCVITNMFSKYSLILIKNS